VAPRLRHQLHNDEGICTQATLARFIKGTVTCVCDDAFVRERDRINRHICGVDCV